MYQSKVVMEQRGDDKGGLWIGCSKPKVQSFRCQEDPRGHIMPTVQLCKYDILLHILAQLVMCQENEVARGQVRSFFGCGGASRVFQGSCRAFSCIFINKHTNKQSHGASGVISCLFFFAHFAI